MGGIEDIIGGLRELSRFLSTIDARLAKLEDKDKKNEDFFLALEAILQNRKRD